MLGQLIVVLVVLADSATPFLHERNNFQTRQTDNYTVPYVLPVNSPDSAARAQGIETKRETFLYGPDPDGSTLYYPSDSLGNATTAEDGLLLETEESAHAQLVAADMALAEEAITTVSSLFPVCKAEFNTHRMEVSTLLPTTKYFTTANGRRQFVTCSGPVPLQTTSRTSFPLWSVSPPCRSR